MAVQITTYAGLQSAVAAWLAREGDGDLANRADDFLALCEQRLYYGKPALAALGIPEHEAVRIPEMYRSDPGFALAQGAAQPAGFLELVEATLNGADASQPLQIVEESVIDGMNAHAGAAPRLIAVSGTGFRLWPDPGSGSFTATLRWYGTLATPSGANPTNWILANAPGVYLNGCLLEAAIFTQDPDSARYYAALYAADVAGLNIRRQRVLASAHNLRLKLRARTP
ncbi:hypothetical protein [Enhydrobacter sp.]|jgi:hypothetical protein|uniref:phage adaptor protein n=1 Tax=Enhydrobacter sp. TaxID=1894999 RepID=UPI0026375E6C|nr:hypothetical protein [Enhydrobacter sp.]WIM14493.1 MAG: hypothetical protein OJF58_005463 [Enhydrobacter sp.]